MTINLYVNDDTETEITSFNNMASNPFQVGDIISLTVSDLYPVDLDEFNRDARLVFKQENDTCREKFHLRKVKLIRESKHVRFDVLNESELSIQYDCEFLD
jgi:hypothetical protein